jgi:hypothetical protein
VTRARLLRTCLATCVALTVLAGSAWSAVRLTIPVAEGKALVFAEHTCANDEHCGKAGVSDCNRQSPHIVLCRIFLRRKTPVQGKYECTRLIRLAIEPKSHRVPVTGVGRWHC